MSIHSQFIQPIKDMFSRLIRKDYEDIFADHLREAFDERVQRINFILDNYPHHPSKGLPAYHFVDIPDEEFIDNDELSTFLIRDDEGGSGDLEEDQVPLRTDINSVWEVEGIHLWTREGGRAKDLPSVVYVYVKPGNKIKAKLVFIHG